MAAENALAFLRQFETGKPMLPATIVITGTQPFLKEYVLECCCAVARGEAAELRRFHIGNAADLAPLLEAVAAPGLFSSATTAVARILRTRRIRAEGDDESEEQDAGGRGDDGLLNEAIESVRLPSRLILLYERDSAPAKVIRAVEANGLTIACNRPYDSQLIQYAGVFAHRLGVTLSPAALDLIVLKYGGNLLEMHNALALAALVKTIQPPDQFVRSLGGDSRLGGEVFALSESLAGDRPELAFALLDGAYGLGRDPNELLAVEVIPALRRMVTAANLLEQRRAPIEVAVALKLPPRSPMVAVAMDAAKRFGKTHLNAVYRAAVELDRGMKDGTIRDREAALSGLLLALLAQGRPQAQSGARGR